MLTAVAQFIVWEDGRDNLPYFHQHVWPSYGWENAIVEMIDYQHEQEKEHHVTMRCLRWWCEERSDIGI